jgi:Flp pilus assembly protein TadB
LSTSQSRRSRRAKDLAITGRTPDGYFAQLAVGGIVGALLPLAADAALRLFGLDLALAGAALASLTCLACGCGTPMIGLSVEARKARASARHALSCWLELVVLGQAGGMGVEGALEAASRVSNDLMFVRVRAALRRARHEGSSPWEALGRLGAELGIADLQELAANLALAGTEGARVRASLAAKASSMRRRELNDAQAKANSTTERLFLPSIVLMLGFLIFLMYPAGISLTKVL